MGREIAKLIVNKYTTTDLDCIFEHGMHNFSYIHTALYIIILLLLANKQRCLNECLNEYNKYINKKQTYNNYENILKHPN